MTAAGPSVSSPLAARLRGRACLLDAILSASRAAPKRFEKPIPGNGWNDTLKLFGAEFGDHIGRDGGTADFFGVVFAARRPDTGFRALNREFAVNRKAMLDVEA